MLPRVLIVTGAMAAGKSTIAQALAERLERSVHLRGDVFRRMIVSGRAVPGEGEAGQAQLKLRYELAAMAADRYAEAGFSVVWQDCILRQDLPQAAERLARWRPGVVVLAPRADVLAHRDRTRHKMGYENALGWTPERFAAMVEETPRLGLRLDTSALTIEQTMAAILADPEATRAGL